MIQPLRRSKKSLVYRIFCSFLVSIITLNFLIPANLSYAQVIPLLNLPLPGSMVGLTPGYNPVLIKGITLYPDNPLEFDFLINSGNSDLQGEALKDEANKLIKYFLASLTVPEQDFWVNLSPYEKDRIIPNGLGITEMGRDLLAQDYILKQLTASLVYPEDNLGKEFWKRVYKQAQEKFGTTDIPLNTFNKIWIVPNKAVVYEKDNNVFVIESSLKVMLEEDYLALQKNLGNQEIALDKVQDEKAREINKISSDVVREVLLPEIQKEVNEGKNFANLRQIYNSLILAVWYKMNLKESLLGQVYADQNKTKGVDVEDPNIKEKIYQQYLEAFKKGAYDYIKEDYDAATKQIVPRQYFSGGTNLEVSPQLADPDNRIIAKDGEKLSKSQAAALREDKGNGLKVHTNILEANGDNAGVVAQAQAEAQAAAEKLASETTDAAALGGRVDPLALYGQLSPSSKAFIDKIIETLIGKKLQAGAAIDPDHVERALRLALVDNKVVAKDIEYNFQALFSKGNKPFSLEINAIEQEIEQEREAGRRLKAELASLTSSKWERARSIILRYMLGIIMGMGVIPILEKFSAEEQTYYIQHGLVGTETQPFRNDASQRLKSEGPFDIKVLEYGAKDFREARLYDMQVNDLIVRYEDEQGKPEAEESRISFEQISHIKMENPTGDSSTAVTDPAAIGNIKPIETFEEFTKENGSFSALVYTAYQDAILTKATTIEFYLTGSRAFPIIYNLNADLSVEDVEAARMQFLEALTPVSRNPKNRFTGARIDNNIYVLYEEVQAQSEIQDPAAIGAQLMPIVGQIENNITNTDQDIRKVLIDLRVLAEHIDKLAASEGQEYAMDILEQTLGYTPPVSETARYQEVLDNIQNLIQFVEWLSTEIHADDLKKGITIDVHQKLLLELTSNVRTLQEYAQNGLGSEADPAAVGSLEPEEILTQLRNLGDILEPLGYRKDFATGTASLYRETPREDGTVFEIDHIFSSFDGTGAMQRIFDHGGRTLSADRIPSAAAVTLSAGGLSMEITKAHVSTRGETYSQSAAYDVRRLAAASGQVYGISNEAAPVFQQWLKEAETRGFDISPMPILIISESEAAEIPNLQYADPALGMVKLKNGAEEHLGVVRAVYISLISLMETKPITFYELVMKARDPKHQLFSDRIRQDLQDLGLLESDDSMHDSIRNIVVSSAEGEDLDMRLVSPIAADPALDQDQGPAGPIPGDRAAMGVEEEKRLRILRILTWHSGIKTIGPVSGISDEPFETWNVWSKGYEDMNRIVWGDEGSFIGEEVLSQRANEIAEKLVGNLKSHLPGRFQVIVRKDDKLGEIESVGIYYKSFSPEGAKRQRDVNNFKDMMFNWMYDEREELEKLARGTDPAAGWRTLDGYAGDPAATSEEELKTLVGNRTEEISRLRKKSFVDRLTTKLISIADSIKISVRSSWGIGFETAANEEVLRTLRDPKHKKYGAMLTEIKQFMRGHRIKEDEQLPLAIAIIAKNILAARRVDKKIQIETADPARLQPKGQGEASTSADADDRAAIREEDGMLAPDLSDHSQFRSLMNYEREFQDYKERTAKTFKVLNNAREIPEDSLQAPRQKFRNFQKGEVKAGVQTYTAIPENFEGVTAITWINNRDTEGRIAKLQESIKLKLEKEGLGQKIAFVNPGSFHVTIHDLIVKPGNDNYEQQKQKIFEEVQRAFDQLGRLGDINVEVKGVGMIDGPKILMARVYPRTLADFERMYKIKQAISQHAGIDIKPSFVAHITLGYFVNSLSPEEYNKVLQIINEEDGQNVTLGEYSLGEVRFAEFPNMNEYWDKDKQGRTVLSYNPKDGIVGRDVAPSSPVTFNKFHEDDVNWLWGRLDKKEAVADQDLRRTKVIWDETGNLRPQDGVSLVMPLDHGSEVYKNILSVERQIKDELNRKGLGNKVKFNPVESLHMTFASLDVDRQDNSNPPITDQEIQALNTKIDPILNQAQAMTFGVRGINVTPAFSLAVKVAPLKGQGDPLLAVKRELSQNINSMVADKLEFYVVNLGYVVDTLNNEELTAFREIIKGFRNVDFGFLPINNLNLIHHRHIIFENGTYDIKATYKLQTDTPLVQSRSPIDAKESDEAALGTSEAFIKATRETKVEQIENAWIEEKVAESLVSGKPERYATVSDYFADAKREAYGDIVVQYNKARGDKRKPDDPPATVVPGRSGFSFMKVDWKRAKRTTALFNKQSIAGIPVEIIRQGAPLGKGGHFLLLPNMDPRRPQVLDEDAIKVALTYMAKELDKEHLKIGFNSWRAFGSVNHLHLQALYYQDENNHPSALPVEKEEFQSNDKKDIIHIGPIKFSTLNDKYPVRGFTIEGNEKDIAELVSVIATIMKILQRKGQPHNVIFTKTSEGILKTYIFPRKPEANSRLGTGVAFFELGGELVSLYRTAADRDKAIETEEAELGELQSDEKQAKQLGDSVIDQHNAPLKKEIAKLEAETTKLEKELYAIFEQWPLVDGSYSAPDEQSRTAFEGKREEFYRQNGELAKLKGKLKLTTQELAKVIGQKEDNIEKMKLIIPFDEIKNDTSVLRVELAAVSLDLPDFDKLKNEIFLTLDTNEGYEPILHEGIINEAWDRKKSEGMIFFDPEKGTAERRLNNTIAVSYVPGRADRLMSDEKSNASINVAAPFDPDKSQFITFEHLAKDKARIAEFRLQTGRTWLFGANPSPIFKNHFLLIETDKVGRYKYRNQFILQDDFYDALELTGNDERLKLFFNSIGAASTVPQFHFQGFWKDIDALKIDVLEDTQINLTLPEAVEVRKVRGLLSAHLVFQLRDRSMDRKKLADTAYGVVKALQDTNIPYNIFFHQGRIYIFPRAKETPDEFPDVKFGALEMVQYIVLPNWIDYVDVKENVRMEAKKVLEKLKKITAEKLKTVTGLLEKAKKEENKEKQGILEAEKKEIENWAPQLADIQGLTAAANVVSLFKSALTLDIGNIRRPESLAPIESLINNKKLKQRIKSALKASSSGWSEEVIKAIKAQPPSDPAAIGEAGRVDQETTAKPVGGINLDPKLLDLQIKRDGNGVPLPLLQQPIGDMKIEGFFPVIINITPVSLPLLLGLNTEDAPTDNNEIQQGKDKFYREKSKDPEELTVSSML